MESASDKKLEPFGRQPQPVTVIFDGDRVDIEYWINLLQRRAEFKGDMTQRLSPSSFKIFPRAVND